MQLIIGILSNLTRHEGGIVLPDRKWALYTFQSYQTGRGHCILSNLTRHEGGIVYFLILPDRKGALYTF